VRKNKDSFHYAIDSHAYHTTKQVSYMVYIAIIMCEIHNSHLQYIHACVGLIRVRNNVYLQINYNNY